MTFLPAPKATKEEIDAHILRNFNVGKLLSYKKIKKD